MLPMLSLVAAAAAAEPPAPDPYVLVQGWATLYDQDQDAAADPAAYGDPEDDPGLRLRRARLGAVGRSEELVYGLVFGMASPYDSVGGTGDEGVHLVDAYAGFRPVRGLWVVAGQQKVPVGREELVSSERLVFAERSVATEWTVPGRDAGLVLDGRAGSGDGLRARLRLGAFNGNGSALGDRDAGKLLSARFEARVGPGAVYRTWGVVDGPTAGVAVDAWTDRSATTDTLGYGGDAMVRLGGLALLLDAHVVRVGPTGDPVELPGTLAPTTRVGATAQLGATVGPLEPAVRVAVFDDDTETDDNGDVLEVFGGATWHSPDDALRAGLGYVHRGERAGASFPNDSARLWFQLAL